MLHFIFNLFECLFTALRRAAGIQRTSSTVSSVSEIDESTQDSITETLNVEVNKIIILELFTMFSKTHPIRLGASSKLSLQPTLRK